MSASDNDIKRENANIDGDTAMGTMLKYGSEGAKQFYEMYVLDPKHSQAHIERRYPHTRPGLPDAHHHLLPDRPAQAVPRRFLHRPRFPARAERYFQLRGACVHCHSVQPERPARRSERPELRLRHGGAALRKPSADCTPRTLRRRCKLLPGIEDYTEVLAEVKLMQALSQQETDMYSMSGRTTTVIKEAEAQIALRTADEPTRLQTSRQFATEACRSGDRPRHLSGDGSPGSQPEHHAFPRRRADTVQLHQLRHGYHPRRAEWSSRTSCWPTEAGLGNGETPIFPIHIFKVKEGVNYNPGRPELRSVQAGMPGFCKAAVPELLVHGRTVSTSSTTSPATTDTEVAYMGCRTRVIGNVYDPSREIVTRQRQPELYIHQPARVWPSKPTAILISSSTMLERHD